MPGTIMLSLEGEVSRCRHWVGPYHRSQIIETWRRESGQKWMKAELIITIEETSIKNKLFPPKKKAR